jgi:hypothetical protein
MVAVRMSASTSQALATIAAPAWRSTAIGAVLLVNFGRQGRPEILPRRRHRRGGALVVRRDGSKHKITATPVQSHDFEVELTGFEMGEIDIILDDVGACEWNAGPFAIQHPALWVQQPGLGR